MAQASPSHPIKGYYELLPFTEPDGQPYVDYTYPRSKWAKMGILYGGVEQSTLA